MIELDKEHMEIYARLSVLVAISEAQIKNNPLPHLAKAANRVGELEQAVRDAAYALGPNFAGFIQGADAVPEFKPVGVEEYNRNREAARILRKVIS